MKNIILVIAAALFSFNATAQITKVSLQASGLTCSMCSNAINKSLKSIDFVDRVEANIKNSTFDISFKPGAGADLDKLKKKVEDAGFLVAKMDVTINFDNVVIENDSHVIVRKQFLQLVHLCKNLSHLLVIIFVNVTKSAPGVY